MASQFAKQLASIDQSDVLRFYDSLSAAEKQKLDQQLAGLDLGAMQQLIETQVRTKAAIPIPKDIQPVKAYPNTPGPDQKKLYVDAEARGLELLKASSASDDREPSGSSRRRAVRRNFPFPAAYSTESQ